jgi:hypothetical protein
MTQPAYKVVDTCTQRVAAQTNISVEAYAAADRMDARYGAVCTRVERDYDVMSDEEFASMMQVAA